MTGEDGAGEDGEDGKAAPLPKMSIERQLLLSHARGVVTQEQFELCLHAAQQAGVCTTVFCRQAMQRSTTRAVEPARAPSGGEGDGAISRLLDEAKHRAAMDESS